MATQLSGCDFNGYPQLTLLAFAIDACDYEVESKARFYEYLRQLHMFQCKVITEKAGAQ